MFFRRRRVVIPEVRVSHHDAAASAAATRLLGALVALCAEHEASYPAIISLQHVNGYVRLQLATPAQNAPAPWVASADGCSWHRHDERFKVSTRPDSSGLAPSSGLVAIGLADRPTMLVDLVRARGLVGLDGQRAARLEIAYRWMDEYSRAPWSRVRIVALVDLPELSSAVTVTMTIRNLITAIESGSPGLAFVRTLPAGMDGIDLRRALKSPAGCWAVVVLDDTEFARWTFLAAANGSVTSDVFPPDPIVIAAEAPAIERTR